MDAQESAAGRVRCPVCEAEKQTIEAVRDLDRYIAAIRPEDRTPEEEYEKRLKTCGTCPRNDSGTCLSCGCLVRIRAAQKHGRCPDRRWQKP